MASIVSVYNALPKNVALPETVRVPLIFVLAFLIVVVPEIEPIKIVLAAPSTLALVTVVLSKLNVVALLVIVPPLAITLPAKVASPVTERVLFAESGPFTINASVDGLYTMPEVVSINSEADVFVALTSVNTNL